MHWDESQGTSRETRTALSDSWQACGAGGGFGQQRAGKAVILGKATSPTLSPARGADT